MSGYTPGPWRVTAGIIPNPRVIVVNDLDLPVCALSLRSVHGDLNVMHANARLISAAPELLEALREMATQHRCGCGHPHCNRCEDDRRCAEVIAKTTGGAA